MSQRTVWSAGTERSAQLLLNISILLLVGCYWLPRESLGLLVEHLPRTEIPALSSSAPKLRSLLRWRITGSESLTRVGLQLRNEWWSVSLTTLSTDPRVLLGLPQTVASTKAMIVKAKASDVQDVRSLLSEVRAEMQGEVNDSVIRQIDEAIKKLDEIERADYSDRAAATALLSVLGSAVKLIPMIARFFDELDG